MVIPFKRREKLFLLSNILFGSKDVIKIHGTLRVGTNYLKKLLDANFRGRALLPEEHGWKHGKIKYSDKFKYIIMVKDPIAWVLSFWKWEKLHNRSDSKNVVEFIENNLTHEKLKNEWSEVDVIKVWNKSYQYWMQYVENDNVTLVRYEDLINDFDETMSALMTGINLEKKADVFVNITKRADEWKTQRVMEALNVDSYRKKQYLSVLGAETVSLIRSKLDNKILDVLGYDYLYE